MTREELVRRWTDRREDLERLLATVSANRIIDEFLADVSAVFATEEDTLLTLREAARESGYSPDHLGRLVRDGAIPNAGRPRSPRIRRKDLPRKALPLPASRPVKHLVGATPEQIARSVVNSQTGETR